MKKTLVFSALVGGALGAVATVLALVLFGKDAPMDSRDLLSFVLSTVSIVIAALTVLGAVIVVMTWNDIDERTGKIVAKYEQEAKTGIEDYRQKKEAELDENARVRQEAIDQAAGRSISMMGTVKKQMNNNLHLNLLLLGVMGACLIYLWNKVFSRMANMDQWEKRLSQVERSTGTRME